MWHWNSWFNWCKQRGKVMEGYHVYNPQTWLLITVVQLNSPLLSSRLRSAAPEPAAEIQSFLFLPAAPLPWAHALHQWFQGGLLYVGISGFKVMVVCLCVCSYACALVYVSCYSIRLIYSVCISATKNSLLWKMFVLGNKRIHWSCRKREFIDRR